MIPTHPAAASLIQQIALIRANPFAKLTGMSFLNKTLWTDKVQPALAILYHWLRIPGWLLLGIGLGFALPYFWYLDRLVKAGFDNLTYELPSRVFARPLRLERGQRMDLATLKLELAAARYAEADPVIEPGTFSLRDQTFEIHTREFIDGDGRHRESRLLVGINRGRVNELRELGTDTDLESALIDPARIATLYGKSRQERRLVKLSEVPPLFVQTLLAVEDKNFYGHHGVDPKGLMRALWVNASQGELSQGGSTLTQQLVRNLFLDRRKKLARKLNEMAIALTIEHRYSKDKILEAYLNEVYLGQHGAQAVHGIGAASEFYFGRDLNTLRPHEIALLVGIIKGPSVYDPRRASLAALKRRNLVLQEMAEAKLISPFDAETMRRQGLSVVGGGALPQNRYPAFMALVRAQLSSDFDSQALATEGLSIFTSLAPSTQQYAEKAVSEKIKTLAKDTSGLEAAMVVTHAATGSIEAMVGGRNPDEPGFNRAMDAARPIGSLVKPFVYLVALAQPDRYSLITPLDDTEFVLRQRGAPDWRPRNSDNQEHGTVPLIDALARSYNIATVRLGVGLDVNKVRRVLEALIPGAKVSPHPSLLLGATELSPLQVAQAYQYLAADGHLVALNSVRAVIDAHGRPLSRYASQQNAGDLVQASRLVTYALQEAARTGTAASLTQLGLADLEIAGKTGTSDDKRDSWFAGYTGSHLAVVWLGRDNNDKAGFYGATGAMRLWAGLFEKLPTEPLRLDLGHDPAVYWVNPSTQMLTEPDCDGARAIPFIRDYQPVEFSNCGGFQLDDWLRERFSRDDEVIDRHG
ncbi:penicillin-binding protein 1B [Ahniella affigens]|uniref:Penicillin-binding protein 1B n=1 Tax=Ahniella affigens TaxID=2021234 RepID=A0A2P1PP21_9GAMM|nr:penicillin-binding protein 1B [Ahniella affigens]